MKKIHILKQQAREILANAPSDLAYQELREDFYLDGAVYTLYRISGFNRSRTVTVEINIQLNGLAQTGHNPSWFDRLPDWNDELMVAFYLDLRWLQWQLNNFIRRNNLLDAA